MMSFVVLGGVGVLRLRQVMRFAHDLAPLRMTLGGRYSGAEWAEFAGMPTPSRGRCGSMKFHTEYLTLHTKTKRAYVHLTPQVESALKKSGIKDGMILVSAMHITAGVYVNDNESGLIEDIDQWLEKLAPFRQTTSITRPAKTTETRT